jgi:uncharacterized flavoprotein (TIGR03862 family)
MKQPDVLIIGAGPAGLMAAETMALRGRDVMIVEAKPSPARKFLMAGKSGLNITRDEPIDTFCDHVSADWMRPILAEFGPQQVMDWARNLGEELFTGSTGRVFPVRMKASPLLRAWLARLARYGIDVKTRWRWNGFDGDTLLFETPEGLQRLTPKTTILGLGGASWPRLGSDAAWVPWLQEKGVEITPFEPANMGFVLHWSDHMSPYLGAPVKNVALRAGATVSRGEFVISARGIEGGGIYALAARLRKGAMLTLDLFPDLTLPQLTAKLQAKRGKATVTNWLRKTLNLDPVKLALLMEWARPLPSDPGTLAERLKAIPVPHQGPRPLDEAISSAGGITRESVDEALQLRALPGIYVCGEMLDWEAPTGGYLLTSCFAQGRHVGLHAS